MSRGSLPVPRVMPMGRAFRLLEGGSGDARLDLALNEAAFRGRWMDLVPDTLRIWQGPASVIMGGRAMPGELVDRAACGHRGVAVARAPSIEPCVIFADRGDLNFALAMHAGFVRNLVMLRRGVFSEDHVINEGIATGLRTLGVMAEAGSSGVQVSGTSIMETIAFWFHDFLLFQGTVHVDTDLDLRGRFIVGGTKEAHGISSLAKETGLKLSSREVEHAVVSGLGESLGLMFQGAPQTGPELEAAGRLLRLKYGRNSWTINARDPFLIGMGKLGIEVLVAYPPTSLCRRIITLVEEAVSDLEDRVEVRVWMHGRGLEQHGPLPEYSSGLTQAQKCNVVPAIIIGGELVFPGEVPTREALRRAVLDHYDDKNDPVATRAGEP